MRAAWAIPLLLLAMPLAAVGQDSVNHPLQRAAAPGSFRISEDGLQVTTAGVVAPAQRVVVPARIAGIVKELQVKSGQKIDEGTLLALLEDRKARVSLDEAKTTLVTAQRRVMAAQAAVAQSQIDLKIAQDDWERARASRERLADAVSDAEFARRQLTVERAESEVQLKQAALAAEESELMLSQLKITAREGDLDEHRILAPFRGTVSSVSVRPGQWCDLGDPVLELIDIDQLTIRLFVPASWARLSADQVSISLLIDQVEVEANVAIDFVSPEIDLVREVVAVQLKVEGSQLIPGQRVDVVLVRDAHEDDSDGETD